jgi:hypothetical protein
MFKKILCSLFGHREGNDIQFDGCYSQCKCGRCGEDVWLTLKGWKALFGDNV